MPISKHRTPTIAASNYDSKLDGARAELSFAANLGGSGESLVAMSGRRPGTARVTVNPDLAPSLREDEQLMTRAAQMLDGHIVVTVTARTRSGAKLQDYRHRGKEADLGRMHLSDDARVRVPSILQQEGCRILRINRFSITIAAPVRLLAELTGQPLQLNARAETGQGPRELQSHGEMASSVDPAQLFFAPPQSLSIAPRNIDPLIEDFVFVPPPIEFGRVLIHPPKPRYHHLSQAAMRRLLQVRRGQGDGQGEKVCIVDSGFWPGHPYFGRVGACVDGVPVPGGTKVGIDASGHGTAISRNVLMVAPKAELVGISYAGGAGSSGTLIEAALEIAAEQGPSVINCSWGWEHEQSWPGIEMLLRELVDEGHIIVFAAGNGRMRSWPASLPEVISVGGVYADEQGELQASNFASGFHSDRYPGRLVPDVSALCGQQPHGIYIPLPCPPGSDADRGTGLPFPEGDETRNGDGWCVMSGTSSAAPQVSGVIALMCARARSQGRRLAPAEVRDLLQQSALEIHTGSNAFGLPSLGRPNVATGHGLVQAAAALNLM